MAVIVTHKAMEKIKASLVASDPIKALEALKGGIVGDSAGGMPRGARGGRTPGRAEGMNKLEADYAQALKMKALRKAILWWAWQPIKIRLADNTFYEVDFLVMTAEGLIEVHEVKGHWEDDARVKIKVAAQMLPFRFLAITHTKGDGWQVEVIAE
jgi:hypothetical protein